MLNEKIVLHCEFSADTYGDEMKSHDRMSVVFQALSEHPSWAECGKGEDGVRRYFKKLSEVHRARAEGLAHKVVSKGKRAKKVD